MILHIRFRCFTAVRYVLSILFLGVYGDVIRVKIMFNKKDNALVQFNDATQAQTGKLPSQGEKSSTSSAHNSSQVMRFGIFHHSLGNYRL